MPNAPRKCPKCQKCPKKLKEPLCQSQCQMVPMFGSRLNHILTLLVRHPEGLNRGGVGNQLEVHGFGSCCKRIKPAALRSAPCHQKTCDPQIIVVGYGELAPARWCQVNRPLSYIALGSCLFCLPAPLPLLGTEHWNHWQLNVVSTPPVRHRLLQLLQAGWTMLLPEVNLARSPLPRQPHWPQAEQTRPW